MTCAFLPCLCLYDSMILSTDKDVFLIGFLLYAVSIRIIGSLSEVAKILMNKVQPQHVPIYIALFFEVQILKQSSVTGI